MTQLASNVHYYPETGYIMLDVARPASLPPQLELDETSFIAKDELHIGLLDCRRATESLPTKEEALVDIFSDISRIAVLGAVAVKPPLYDCQKPQEAARSIIAKAEVIGVHAMFTILRERAGIAVPDPFMHVALYTSAGDSDVAVRNRIEFEELCTPVKLPEIEALLAPQPARPTSWW